MAITCPVILFILSRLVINSHKRIPPPPFPPSTHTYVTIISLYFHHNLLSLRKKATIHQLTTMLATSKNVLFPGHNHLLTTGTDDLTL